MSQYPRTGLLLICVLSAACGYATAATRRLHQSHGPADIYGNAASATSADLVNDPAGRAHLLVFLKLHARLHAVRKSLECIDVLPRALVSRSLTCKPDSISISETMCFTHLPACHCCRLDLEILLRTLECTLCTCNLASTMWIRRWTPPRRLPSRTVRLRHC